MKKNVFLGLFLTLLSISAFAQNSKSFQASGFSKLSMGSAFKVDVKQGNKFSITATGRSEDLQDLELRVSGQELKVGYKGTNWNKNRKEVKFDIVMPALSGVEFSGASNVVVHRFSGVKNMDVEVSGASEVTMDFDAEKVAMELSGASKLVLNGKCDILNGEVSGASTFRGKSFPAREVNIDASGASSAAVVGNAVIHAEASGASSIRYSGSAKNVHSSTSGASSIHRE